MGFADFLNKVGEYIAAEGEKMQSDYEHWQNIYSRMDSEKLRYEYNNHAYQIRRQFSRKRAFKEAVEQCGGYVDWENNICNFS